MNECQNIKVLQKTVKMSLMKKYKCWQ